eukprot:Hpha_TRINITY_DN15398_c1_g1::TRINITY_DN15398_c1_g1_i1::g.88583::m.88583/K02942/RP-LP1, RPLP1; large subunit ribosomal protein LP1
MASAQQEIATAYASLIAYEQGSEVTAEKIGEVLKAAGMKVEPFYPTLFAGFLAKADLSDLLGNISAGGGGGAPAAAAPAGGEEKKGAAAPPPAEESEEEEADFGLFD